MSSNKIITIGVSLVALIALAWGVFAFTGKPQPVETDIAANASPVESIQGSSSTDQKLDLIVDGLSRLSHDLNDVSQRVAALEEHEAAGSKGDTKTREVEHPMLSDEELAAQRRIFEVALEDSFNAEPIAEDWSLAAQDKVNNLFLNTENQLYQNSNIKNLECRSTSCKIELVLEEQINRGDFEGEFLSDVAELGFPRVRGYQATEGGQTAEVYFLSPPTAVSRGLREGHGAKGDGHHDH